MKNKYVDSNEYEISMPLKDWLLLHYPKIWEKYQKYMNENLLIQE